MKRIGRKRAQEIIIETLLADAFETRTPPSAICYDGLFYPERPDVTLRDLIKIAWG